MRSMLAVCAAAAALVVLPGCGDDDQPVEAMVELSSTTTTTAKETTTTTRAPLTTTTTVATTTTTSVGEAIAASLRVTPVVAYADPGDYGDHSLKIGFVIENLSGKGITAWQTLTDVSAVDALGRRYAMRLRMECTDAPLGPGESRNPPSPTNDSLDGLNARIAGYDNCTLASWDVNRFIDEEIGLWSAIDEGVVPTMNINVTRVVFDDGSSLGTAVG